MGKFLLGILTGVAGLAVAAVITNQLDCRNQKIISDRAKPVDENEDDDLIFTKNGLFFVHNNVVKDRLIPYSEVEWNDKQNLCIGTNEFNNKLVNKDKLYGLCKILAQA